jgi:hypothetical protein
LTHDRRWVARQVAALEEQRVLNLQWWGQWRNGSGEEEEEEDEEG